MFKRYDGFLGSVPQKFVDSNLPKCPMCGTMKPHWTLNQRMGMTNNFYLFKCEQCGCVLSATIADVSGYSRNILNDGGIIKAFSGKKVGAVYVKVEKVGNAQVTNVNENKEFELTTLQMMADEIK